MKFTLLTHDVAPRLVGKCRELRESPQVQSGRVNQSRT
jgi:hypothetical protein